MDAVMEDVKQLVEKELKTANENFPKFCSAHEGAAVIYEELCEAKEAVECADKSFCSLWRYVRHDQPCNGTAEEIYNASICLAIEAIQLTAMAKKFIDSDVSGGVSMLE